MARRFRCPRPVNRLVMLRTKGLSGPFFQNTGGSCVKGTGNYWAPGMPGSGPRATSGIVTDATTIRVNFSQCVSIPGPTYTSIQYQINGGSWVAVTAATKITDTQWDFTTGTINPGDAVRWRYVGGADQIVDCNEAADIGDQEILVENPLVLGGSLILLEVGGMDVVLLEDAAVDPDDAIALEDRQ